MCEQCLTNPLEFGQPLPGFFLMRARRDGNDWMKGEWGLIEINDPSFIWTTTPKSETEIFDVPDDFITSFVCDPCTGHKLVEAAKTKGYQPDKTSFTFWFFNYLGEWLKTCPMKEAGDPFPHLEKFKPSDLTIGREPLPSELE